MTRHIDKWLSFLAGVCFTAAYMWLLGEMQHDDAQQEAIKDRVIACSQVAEVCSVQVAAK